MTCANPTGVQHDRGKTPDPKRRFRLPDQPPREPDELTTFDRMYKLGNNHHLSIHLGNPDTTLVEANRCMIGRPSDHLSLARQPDLITAIDVDPAAYAVNNGCVVSEQ